MGFLSVLTFAQRLVEQRVQPGDLVIDATAGNGVDTLFLAKTVGPRGIVHAFDIQQQALDNTRERLLQAGVTHVQLHLRSHADLKDILEEGQYGHIAAVMFNLGYLPGKEDNLDVITLPGTTVTALNAAAGGLRKGGVITVVLYTAHPGGAEEAAAVENWAMHLPSSLYHVIVYRSLRANSRPPYVLAVERRA